MNKQVSRTENRVKGTRCLTHEVLNQPPPVPSYNAYETDAALKEALHREGGSWGEKRLQSYGSICGNELPEIGRLANENPPEPRVYDKYGHRIDEVDFHPAYHQSMAIAKEHDLHGLTWNSDHDGAQVVRSALAYLHNQFEAGTMCPITMTHACVPTLQRQPDVAEQWLPRVLANTYDSRCLPASEKKGLTMAMAMTEKQGGSDVRSNSTEAFPVGRPGPGMEYELLGHKWFVSAPMSDAFMALAYSQGGLSCFLLPKWRPDGTRNQLHIQRLKDKLGDRSNASSEMEFLNAFGWMIGPEGRGIPTIIEMVMQTRLDCALGSAALMRQAFAQAYHHCAHREVFGKLLTDQPIMINVLADLALESEAALAMAMRLARAFDSAARGEEYGKLLSRVMTPITKYWVCKRTPPHVNEAQECMGGAGYVEEHMLPRLYRQAPVNSIWEGSGNVQCADVLRAMNRSPDSVEVLLEELRAAQGVTRAYDDHLRRLEKTLASHDDLELRARRLTEDLALALQASVLIRAGQSAISDIFCAARLDRDSGLAFGSLPGGADMNGILRRASPTGE